MGEAGDGGTLMADETGTSSRRVSAGRVVSKKAANRAAAAKVYAAAMKKAGDDVPAWVTKLARLAS